MTRLTCNDKLLVYITISKHINLSDLFSWPLGSVWIANINEWFLSIYQLTSNPSDLIFVYSGLNRASWARLGVPYYFHIDWLICYLFFVLVFTYFGLQYPVLSSGLPSKYCRGSTLVNEIQDSMEKCTFYFDYRPRSWQFRFFLWPPPLKKILDQAFWFATWVRLSGLIPGSGLLV